MAALWLLAQTGGASAASLSLDGAVQLALANHLDIKLAANSEEQARYALESSEGSLSPSVDVGNTFYLSRVRRAGSSSSSSLSLSLPLYSGGRHEGNIDAARLDVEMARLAAHRTRQDVRLSTVSAYYDVLNAQKVQAVDQETVDNYLLHLDNVRAQYGAGSVAKADVLRSEVELADAQQTLLQAQNATAVAWNNLKKLLRWKSAEPLELADDFRFAPLAPAQEECVAQALKGRPDLQQYRLGIEQAQRKVDVAGADKKPSVSLVAGTSWSASVLPAAGEEDAYVGVSTSWNVFDGKVTAGKVKQARSAVDAARLTLASQEDDAEVAVKEYYLGVRAAAKRLETTQVAVRKAEEDHFIAAAKYRAGEGVLLDVLDAQLALSTAKNNYIAAQYDYAVNKAKLEHAMGLE